MADRLKVFKNPCFYLVQRSLCRIVISPASVITAINVKHIIADLLRASPCPPINSLSIRL